MRQAPSKVAAALPPETSKERASVLFACGLFARALFFLSPEYIVLVFVCRISCRQRRTDDPPVKRQAVSKVAAVPPASKSRNGPMYSSTVVCLQVPSLSCPLQEHTVHVFSFVELPVGNSGLLILELAVRPATGSRRTPRSIRVYPTIGLLRVAVHTMAGTGAVAGVGGLH